MGDILVRIPERQQTHFFGDKMTSELAFWRFAKRPRNLAVGDFIFFSTSRGTVAGAQVQEITTGHGLDRTLNKKQLRREDPSGAVNVVWPGRETVHFTAVTGINYAQQSFRYLTSEESKRLRRQIKRGVNSL